VIISEFLLLDSGAQPALRAGAAGSGKSTFCRWLALSVAEGQVPAHRRIAVDDTRFTETLPDTLVGRLPLLVRLRDWASHPEFLAGNGRWTCEQLVASLAGWLDKTRPGKRDDVQPAGSRARCSAPSSRPGAAC
jgi:hypothetical protein